MSDNNVIKKNFKNYKKTPQARRKLLIRILAVFGALLMLSGLVASLFYYI